MVIYFDYNDHVKSYPLFVRTLIIISGLSAVGNYNSPVIKMKYKNCTRSVLSLYECLLIKLSSPAMV